MNRTSVICTVAGALAAGALVASTTAGTASASDSARSHTLTFRSHTLGSTNAGTGGHLLIESDRAASSGRTIGYTANTCAFDFTTHQAHCYVSLARPRGQMRFKATVSVDTGAITGKVVGGTGVYKGITGTVTGHPSSTPDVPVITIHWNG
ncbi:MAG TPA: hypothetical protein VGK78_13045 [Nocardioides sp.]|uniref:hypothetical protein n=1 Tax=Nocardioides sp. TaxID=35761 RepID=UPI002F40E7F1